MERQRYKPVAPLAISATITLSQSSRWLGMRRMLGRDIFLSCKVILEIEKVDRETTDTFFHAH